MFSYICKKELIAAMFSSYLHWRINLHFAASYPSCIINENIKENAIPINSRLECLVEQLKNVYNLYCLSIPRSFLPEANRNWREIMREDGSTF